MAGDADNREQRPQDLGPFLIDFGGFQKVLVGFFKSFRGVFKGLGGYPPSPQNPRKSPAPAVNSAPLMALT